MLGEDERCRDVGEKQGGLEEAHQYFSISLNLGGEG
jgi:hypothetical protein